MGVIREVRNVLDGPYKIVESSKESEDRKKNPAGIGFREEQSRVVRKLLELGLAIPEKGDAKRESRR